MTFGNPWGFFALLGIPVLILIYIIKNQYTEKVVSSTYIWELSERFLKKRLPISRLVGILSLILQILLVAFFSFALSEPVVILPKSASAYCFVLDGSGSMNIEQDGKTRFELAKKEIGGIIKGAADGSTYTLIYARDSTEAIYKDVKDKDRALTMLEGLDVGYGTPDFVGTLDAAQAYFDDNRHALTYVVTDTAYETTKNVTVLNVAKDAETVVNYAIADADYAQEGAALIVSGEIFSYAGNAAINIDLYFDCGDGEDGEILYEYYGTESVEAKAGEYIPFTFTCNKAAFRAAKAVIRDKDALALDNEIVLYDVRYENIAATLLVSEGPFYVRAALEAAGNGKVDAVTPEEYESERPAGYGLYIFDSYSPTFVPQDGTVWFINPQSTVAGTNFTYQGEMEPEKAAKYTAEESAVAQELLSGTVLGEFTVGRYSKCGVGGNFTVLATCEGDPVLFVGANQYGNREAVFAFSLYDSAPFTLSADCATLFANLLEYSFPNVIDETSYICGETMFVNVTAGCDYIKIYTPMGHEAYLDAAAVIGEYRLDEAGAYRIVMSLRNGAELRTYNVYASVPEEERLPDAESAEFVLEGLALKAKFDGTYNILFILFILIAALAIADYGVYSYEQYQLR